MPSSTACTASAAERPISRRLNGELAVDDLTEDERQAVSSGEVR